MSKGLTGFALANVGGIALYVFLFLQILQTIRHEQRAEADFGDGLAFLTTAFPVLVFFVMVDLIWVAVMTNQQRKHKDSKVALSCGIVALAAWAVTFLGLRQVS